MRIALERIGMNLTLRIPTIRYMLVMVSDEYLHNMGFEYDAYNTTDPIRFNGGNGSPEMREILNAHIIPLNANPIPDLTGTGLLESYAGEYVKFDHMKMSSSGTLEDLTSTSRELQIDSTDIGTPLAGPQNGFVVYLDGALTSSNTNVGDFLKNNLAAENPTSPFYKFYSYLTATDLYSATDGVIKGVEVGLNYTLLIPNNEAMEQAIADGVLPASERTTNPLEIEKIKRFLLYHITRNSFAIDGKKTGAFETLCKDIEGAAQSITVVSNQPNMLQVRDIAGRTIEADIAHSNELGQRVLVHSLKGYLQNEL